MKSLPNFFLIGAQKAGTTAVAETLSRHPEIFISEPKEPSFFVYQGGNPYGWKASGRDSLAWYQSLYHEAQNRKVLGDASPYYIYCHHCAEQIYRFNPDAKIIAILRNPLFRAFSMYRYWHMNSPRPISPDDFIDCFQHEKLHLRFEASRKLHVGWLRDAGYYGMQLKRYFDVFPRDNIKVLFYHHLVNDPQAFYNNIFEHLAVAPIDNIAAVNRVTNITVERRFKNIFHLLNRGHRGPVFDNLKKSPLGSVLRHVRDAVNGINVKPRSEWIKFPSEHYAELIAAYHDDIASLEDMLGVDLEGWRDCTML
jgi:hypothetical protein